VVIQFVIPADNNWPTVLSAKPTSQRPETTPSNLSSYHPNSIVTTRVKDVLNSSKERITEIIYGIVNPGEKVSYLKYVRPYLH